MILNNQIEDLRKIMSSRYGREFTYDEVAKHCMAIVYNGVVNKGWSLNGIKVK